MEEVEREIILDELRRELEGENRRLSDNYADVCLESALQTKRIAGLEEALRGIASTANANKYVHEAALLYALSFIEDMALDALDPAKSEASEEQKYYIDVLAKTYLGAEKEADEHPDDASYYVGQLEATEGIAQALGVKARMRKRIEAIEAEGESTERGSNA